MDRRVVLFTERLEVRRLGEGDAPFVLELVNEPGWLEHIGDRGIRALADAVEYVRGGPARSYAEHGFGLYRIGLRRRVDGPEVDEGGASTEPIGICGLLKRDTLPDPDLGFALLARHEGRGYATEAGAAVLAHEAVRCGLRRVLAITSPGNRASMRVLEKIGFRSDGTVAQVGEASALRRFVWERGG